jgi:hypothetical protein
MTSHAARGSHLSGSWRGKFGTKTQLAPKNKPFFAMKKFSSERPFLVAFLGFCKEVTGLKGFKTKTITDDGAQRAFLS